jgi:hypothetical protein
MNDPRIKRGWGTSMTPAGTGNYRGGTASTTRAGGYRTRKNKVEPKPVRKISSVGAGSAFRAGFVTSGGAGAGRK